MCDMTRFSDGAAHDPPARMKEEKRTRPYAAADPFLARWRPRSPGCDTCLRRTSGRSLQHHRSVGGQMQLPGRDPGVAFAGVAYLAEVRERTRQLELLWLARKVVYDQHPVAGARQLPGGKMRMGDGRHA